MSENVVFRYPCCTLQIGATGVNDPKYCLWHSCFCIKAGAIGFSRKSKNSKIRDDLCNYSTFEMIWYYEENLGLRKRLFMKKI